MIKTTTTSTKMNMKMSDDCFGVHLFAVFHRQKRTSAVNMQRVSSTCPLRTEKARTVVHCSMTDHHRRTFLAGEFLEAIRPVGKECKCVVLLLERLPSAASLRCPTREDGQEFRRRRRLGANLLPINFLILTT